VTFDADWSRECISGNRANSLPSSTTLKRRRSASEEANAPMTTSKMRAFNSAQPSASSLTELEARAC
jgi:hypothetical protein